MWEVILFLMSDGPEPPPQNVSAAAQICMTGIRCEPARFDSREACTRFVMDNIFDWMDQTRDHVIAHCMEPKDKRELIG